MSARTAIEWTQVLRTKRLMRNAAVGPRPPRSRRDTSRTKGFGGGEGEGTVVPQLSVPGWSVMP